MKAIDVMVSPVITVTRDMSVAETADILLKNGISAVPVVDATRAPIGIVSESDLMRRAEAGTQRRRSWWLEMLTSSGTIAADFVKSHATMVGDVMTKWPLTVSEETPLAEIADLLESRRIKRVPVVRDGKVVGIISRANLLQAFAAMRRQASSEPAADDRTIRLRVLRTIDEAHLSRPYAMNVTVKDGNVDLWGVVATPEEKTALRVAAEVTRGVASVTNNIHVQAPVTSGL